MKKNKNRNDILDFLEKPEVAARFPLLSGYIFYYIRDQQAKERKNLLNILQLIYIERFLNRYCIWASLHYGLVMLLDRPQRGEAPVCALLTSPPSLAFACPAYVAEKIRRRQTLPPILPVSLESANLYLAIRESRLIPLLELGTYLGRPDTAQMEKIAPFISYAARKHRIRIFYES